MAYTNFPMGYQSYMPQQTVPYTNYNTQVNNSNIQNTSSGIIWVQGEAGAKSYLVAPNCTVQLWDSENQTIYLKSADASGMPSIKTLDYTIRDSSNTTNNPSAPVPQEQTKFVTKLEMEELQKEIESVKGQEDKIEIMQKQIESFKRQIESLRGMIEE